MMRYILFLFLSYSFIFAFNLQPTPSSIIWTDTEKAVINKGNLKLGQSGIVLHKFENNQEMILTRGVVTKTNENNSTIKFTIDDIIVQNAIPTTNLKPSAGDTFLLNHLYDTTLLIVPNFEVNKKIKTVFYNLRYIETDTLAGFLKINNAPVPSMSLFQRFAKEHNIGLLLFVVHNKLHVVDSISLKILESFPITYKNSSTSLPFYTNVEGIQTGVFDFFGEDSIKDYHKYYTKLLGLNNDGK